MVASTVFFLHNEYVEWISQHEQEVPLLQDQFGGCSLAGETCDVFFGSPTNNRSREHCRGHSTLSAASRCCCITPAVEGWVNILHNLAARRTYQVRCISVNQPFLNGRGNIYRCLFLRVHHVNVFFSKCAINCLTNFRWKLSWHLEPIYRYPVDVLDIRVSSHFSHARPVPLVWSHDCQIWRNMSTVVFASPGKLNDCNTDIYTKLI